MMSSFPVWAEGLKKVGTYYKGYVEDLEGTLELHRRDTVRPLQINYLFLIPLPLGESTCGRAVPDVLIN